MKNEIKIGIGAVIIGGLLFYFLKKKKTDINVSQLLPSNSSFDREKCAKEYAKQVFPEMKRLHDLNSVNDPLNQVLTTYRGGLSELTIYNDFIKNMNLISDDSDAETYCKLGKNEIQINDLETQIKIQNLQKKYPNVRWG